ncbi:hypothetical protein [Psychroflexus aestuariivivens]|uniref:hypothetical protein n=1 Tax=Psychroflexus aestuariivivens TaxID=1795040 RepID=UPI000FD9B294|nr:hypothetical protein [Psychroflexus aestuariivivens]
MRLTIKYILIILIFYSFYSCTNDDENLQEDLIKNAIVGNFVLRNQEDVDNFGNQNYSSVKGLLAIGDSGNISSDITSLEPLSSLKGIFGSLTVQNNPGLTSLNGLNNIKYMCFNEPTSVIIDNNQSLNDITALTNIDYCGSTRIVLKNNGMLSNIDAFSNVQAIERLHIEKNENLFDLSPFNNLEVAESILLIEGNFSNIGLNNLKSSNLLNISSCNSVVDVESLSNLTNLKILEIGILSASTPYSDEPSLHNQSLESLEGLRNITDLRIVAIAGSNNLTSLPSFSGNIDAIILHNTAIENLDVFSYTEQELSTSIFLYNNYNLKNVNGLLNFNTLGEIYLVNNTDLDNIDGFDNINQILNGFISIDGNNISQTNSVFENLTSIDFGGLEIKNNTGFEHFSGFNQLQTDFLSVSIHNNSDLISIDGFNMLENSHLIIKENPSLLSINGFENVSEGQLSIGNVINGINQPINQINVFNSSANIIKLKIFDTEITNLDSFQNNSFGNLIQINRNNLLTDFCGISEQVANSSSSTLTYIVNDNGYNPGRFDLSVGNCSN